MRAEAERALRQRHRDAVAVADAARREAAGDRLRQPAQLAVGDERAAVLDDGRRVGRVPVAAEVGEREPLRDVDRRHRRGRLQGVDVAAEGRAHASR